MNFSLKRLLLATTVAAIPFALLSGHGNYGTAMASLVSACLILTAMFIGTRHTKKVVRILVCSLIGMFAGLLFIPPMNGTGYDFFKCVVGGLLAGCCCGIIWNAIRYQTDEELLQFHERISKDQNSA